MEISRIYYDIILMLFLSIGLSSIFKNKKLAICIINCLVLGFFLAMRNPLIVGVDGIRYGETFVELADEEVSSIFLVKENKNIFFYFLNWLCSNTGMTYPIYTALSGFSCAIVISYFIYRFSEMPLLSFMLYIGLGFYTFAFSGQKEAMAMAFIILSYIALYDNKKLMPWIFFILATLSHYTAIVFLPILLISRIRISKQGLKFLLLALIPVLIPVICLRVSIAHWVTSMFAEHYVGQYEITGSLGGTTVFVMLFTILYIFSIGLIGKKKIREESKVQEFFERSLLYACIGSCVIQSFASYAYAFSRLAFYYLQFFVISVPYSLKTARIKKFFGQYYGIIIIILWVLLVGIMIFMFFQHIEGELLQEYMFIWELI